MGYASPTLIPQSTSQSKMSHVTQHTVHSHNPAQQPSATCQLRAFPNVPITSQSPSKSALAQGKPLGMVTPQMPNQMQPPKGVVSPQSPQMSSSKYSGSAGYSLPSKEVSTRATNFSVSILACCLALIFFEFLK